MSLVDVRKGLRGAERHRGRAPPVYMRQQYQWDGHGGRTSADLQGSIRLQSPPGSAGLFDDVRKAMAAGPAEFEEANRVVDEVLQRLGTKNAVKISIQAAQAVSSNIHVQQGLWSLQNGIYVEAVLDEICLQLKLAKESLAAVAKLTIEPRAVRKTVRELAQLRSQRPSFSPISGPSAWPGQSTTAKPTILRSRHALIDQQRGRTRSSVSSSQNATGPSSVHGPRTSPHLKSPSPVGKLASMRSRSPLRSPSPPDDSPSAACRAIRDYPGALEELSQIVAQVRSETDPQTRTLRPVELSVHAGACLYASTDMQKGFHLMHSGPLGNAIATQIWDQVVKVDDNGQSPPSITIDTAAVLEYMKPPTGQPGSIRKLSRSSSSASSSSTSSLSSNATIVPRPRPLRSTSAEPPQSRRWRHPAGLHDRGARRSLSPRAGRSVP